MRTRLALILPLAALALMAFASAAAADKPLKFPCLPDRSIFGPTSADL